MSAVREQGSTAVWSNDGVFDYRFGTNLSNLRAVSCCE